MTAQERFGAALGNFLVLRRGHTPAELRRAFLAESHAVQEAILASALRALDRQR